MQNKELMAAIITLISTLIPVIIGLFAGVINRVKAVRKAKEALAESKTEEERQRAEAEKQAATNDMKEYLLKTVVPTVEGIYDKFSDALTSGGKAEKTFSEAKQDSAISKLQSYAISKNYAFDLEYWIKETNDIINVTKSVNATDKAKAEIKAQVAEQNNN